MNEPEDEYRQTEPEEEKGGSARPSRGSATSGSNGRYAREEGEDQYLSGGSIPVERTIKKKAPEGRIEKDTDGPSNAGQKRASSGSGGRGSSGQNSEERIGTEGRRSRMRSASERSTSSRYGALSQPITQQAPRSSGGTVFACVAGGLALAGAAFYVLSAGHKPISKGDETNAPAASSKPITAEKVATKPTTATASASPVADPQPTPSRRLEESPKPRLTPHHSHRQTVKGNKTGSAPEARPTATSEPHTVNLPPGGEL